MFSAISVVIAERNVGSLRLGDMVEDHRSARKSGNDLSTWNVFNLILCALRRTHSLPHLGLPLRYPQLASWNRGKVSCDRTLPDSQGLIFIQTRVNPEVHMKFHQAVVEFQRLKPSVPNLLPNLVAVLDSSSADRTLVGLSGFDFYAISYKPLEGDANPPWVCCVSQI